MYKVDIKIVSHRSFFLPSFSSSLPFYRIWSMALRLPKASTIVFLSRQIALEFAWSSSPLFHYDHTDFDNGCIDGTFIPLHIAPHAVI
jgi:hypothetical protein